MPIVKLRLTEGLICADYKQFSTSQGRELYKLIKKSNYGNWTKKVGGEYTDPRVSRIGSVDERTLFNDNEIIKVVENLPEYPISQTDKYSWNVYDNSFYPWSLKCDEKVLDSGSKFDRHYLYYVTHTVSEAQSIHLKEKDKGKQAKSHFYSNTSNYIFIHLRCCPWRIKYLFNHKGDVQLGVQRQQ